MAERRAMNKYYPPEWTPNQGSINKFVGQHPLRDRARKLYTEGILVVRFEMPYNIWCEGCKAHIGKGVRYNAQKKKIGKYFSTAIFSFRMKCHLCDNWMEIHTDPKSSDFLIVSGASKKNETWEAEDNETIKLKTDEEAQKLEEDPFYRLEYAAQDVQRAKEVAPQLDKLIDFKEDLKDDYAMSQLVRKKFRTEKKVLENQVKEGQKIGLNIPLLPSTEEDKLIASTVEFATNNDSRKRKLEIKASSIFDKTDIQTPDQKKKKQQQIELLTKKRKLLIGKSTANPAMKMKTSISFVNRSTL